MLDPTPLFSSAHDIRMTSSERDAMRLNVSRMMRAHQLHREEKADIRSLVSSFASVRPLSYQLEEEEITPPSLWLGVNLFACLQPFAVEA